jgi:uncharacterized delta-60 repeat protein
VFFHWNTLLYLAVDLGRKFASLFRLADTNQDLLPGAMNFKRGALVAAFIFSFTANAADGDLDLSFDTDGKVFTDLGSSTDAPFDAVLQTDGKIILVGVKDFGAINQLALVRYNTDGSLDSTYGTGGKAIFPYDGNATAAALTPDGKLVVSFQLSGTRSLSRYNPNGTLDTTFGTAGSFNIPLTNGLVSFTLKDLFILPDGKILGCGSALKSGPTTWGFGLVRLNASGTLDSTFSTGGIAFTEFVGFTSTQANAMAVSSTGKIALAGIASGSVAPFFKQLLAQYNADGSLDMSFGTAGKSFRETTTSLTQETVEFQSDGKLLVAGVTSNVMGTVSSIRRFTTTGVDDSTFGTAGQYLESMNIRVIHDIAIQPNGKIIAFGQARDSAATLGFAVARYLPNGTRDTTFGTAAFGSAGLVVTTFTASSGDLAEASYGFLQPDGKIVAVGNERSNSNGGNNFGMARYINSDAVSAPVDAGVVTDAGMPVVDAGMAVDSGTPVVDAGTPIIDAGTAIDSGTPLVDSGTMMPMDSGTAVDSGMPTAMTPDAGTEMPTMPKGGCQQTAFFAPLGLLLLLALRRNRV